MLSELLVCGECGSPYRRVIWTQKGVKRVVWRCQNRLEHGRKICKQSPTLDEGNIHDAVISAMNELFRMQAAKDAVKAGIAAVLAGEEQTMSLPAVEFQIRNLQERQLELFQLIVSAGADCTDYDEELQQVNMAKTRLMAQKRSWKRNSEARRPSRAGWQNLTWHWSRPAVPLRILMNSLSVSWSATSRCWTRIACSSASRTAQKLLRPCKGGRPHDLYHR